MRIVDINEKGEELERKSLSYKRGYPVFSKDGKVLVYVKDDTEIIVLEFESEKNLGILKGHNYCINSLSFSPDGKTLASGSYDKTIKLWSMETLTEM